MAVWSQVKVRGRTLSPRPTGCTPAQSVTEKRRCSFDMRLVVLYKYYMSFHSVGKETNLDVVYFLW